MSLTKVTKTEVIFAVRMELPEGTNIGEARQFIRNAISGYGGGLDPEDPFFHVSDKDFTVALHEKRTHTIYRSGPKEEESQ